MNKIAKGFLFAGAGVVSTALLALLGMNLYVESAGVQSRLEVALSHELKMPIKASRIRLSLWGKLKVEGLTVVADAAEAGEPLSGHDIEHAFFHAPEVSARLAWPALLAGRLVIRELVILQPTVQWAQTSKGRWELPRVEVPEPAPADKKEAKVRKEKHPPEQKSAEPTPEQAVPTPEGEQPAEGLASQENAKAPGEKSAEPPAKPKREPKKKLEFQVVAARIEDATFRFYDRKQRPLAVFEGVSFDCPSTSTDRAEGVATIRVLTLHDGVRVENITTPYLFENGIVSLPKVEAQLGGGSVTGVFSLNAEESGAPFKLDVKFERVDLHRLLKDADAEIRGQKIDGLAAGALKLEGESGREKSIKGGGEVILSEGRMENNPLFQMIGQALQIEELSRLDLQQSKVDFRVKNARVYIEPLVLESANFSLHAKGTVRFNGKLDLDATLAVNSKISRQFPKWLMSNFKPMADPDKMEIEFEVGGTLDNPDTDLMRVLVGQRLEKQAMDLFKIFRSYGGDKKKEKRDKKDDNAKENEGDGHGH